MKKTKIQKNLSFSRMDITGVNLLVFVQIVGKKSHLVILGLEKWELVESETNPGVKRVDKAKMIFDVRR